MFYHVMFQEIGGISCERISQRNVGNSSERRVHSNREVHLFPITVFDKLWVLEVGVEFDLKYRGFDLRVFHQIHNMLTVIIRYSDIPH